MQERKVTVYITDALFELLKTKNLPDITTTEIIKKAGVCRSSFYRNFYLPEDVIRQYGVALFDEINRKIPIVQGGIRDHIHSVNNLLWLHRERLTLLRSAGCFTFWKGRSWNIVPSKSSVLVCRATATIPPTTPEPRPR